MDTPFRLRRCENYILPQEKFLPPAIKLRDVDDWLLDLENQRSGEPLSNETKKKILCCFRIVVACCYQAPTQISDNTSACSSTVCVAFSCLSGG